MRRLLLILLTLALGLSAAAQAQPDTSAINPDLLTEQWPASWIAHPTASPYDYGVYHFRKPFDLEAVPDSFVVHASADNRYRLFVNGTPVGVGPARSGLRQWRYETYDLAPHLQAGPNVIAALVWNGGEHRPMEQVTHRAAFLLQGNTEAEAVASTDTTWRVLQNEGYGPVVFRDNDPRLFNQYYVAGALDSLDMERYPWGWTDPAPAPGRGQAVGYDDAAWQQAEALDRAAPAGWESHQKWQLVPRPVALLEEQKQRFVRVARAEDVVVPAAFLEGEADLVIPPDTEATVLLDQGAMTTGYPTLVLSGGAGADVRLVYAEALYDSLGRKGHRDEVEGKEMVGVYDRLRPGGGEGRTFRPLGIRSWRYLQLEVQTSDDPLTLHDVYSHASVYPAERVATFEVGGETAASDTPEADTLAALWEMGWRTLLLNAQETFISDLSWERIQYIGDTKVQALAWLYLTDDDALVRQALAQFDASRLPSGLTQSRYPSDLEQVTPLYSLTWVTMVHDYWMLRRDSAFVRSLLPGIAGVLGWFERRLGEDGLVEASSYDFRNRGYRRWRAERYPQASSERMTLHSLFYAYALRQAADLFDHFGKDVEAERYRAQADVIAKTVRACCYDEARGAVSDTPDGLVFTLPPQIFAVLTGAVPPDVRPNLLQKLLDEEISLLPQGRYFFYHLFLGRALKGVGMGERYLETLDPWRRMAGQGLTTFAETAENPRSDAHPWTTAPLYEFLATVAGIEPASPGFRTVRIAPALGPLRHVRAAAAHPEGTIEVELEREGADGLRGTVRLPEGVTGTFEWEGEQVPLHGGLQDVVVTSE